MAKQLALDLRGDIWAQEFEIFSILYGVRCVEDIAQWHDGHMVKAVSRQTNGRARSADRGRGFESRYLPQSAFSNA